MSDRALQVHGKAQDASDKFDYFTCGVAGALFAYIGQHFKPQELPPVAVWLEVFAMGFLTVAFIQGLRRLIHSTDIQSTEARKLDAIHNIERLMDIEGQTKNPTLGTEARYRFDGEDLTGEQVKAKLLEVRAEFTKLKAKVDAGPVKAERTFISGNVCLIFGFVALLAAVIWQTFWPKSPVVPPAPPAITAGTTSNTVLRVTP